MADFSSVDPIFNNLVSAKDILRIFKNIYGACLEVEATLQRYVNDPAFKAQADHLFTVDQISEIGTMMTGVLNLRSDWYVNHKSPLGLPEEIIE
jgi:hypothetical protein